jgi:hypothetical protein
VKYKLGFYIPEDGILHSHRREKLKSLLRIFLIIKEYQENPPQLDGSQDRPDTG